MEKQNNHFELKEKLLEIRSVSLWPIIMKDYISKIYETISKETNIDVSLIKMLKTQELYGYYNNGSNIDKEELLKRYNNGFYIYDRGNESKLFYSEKNLFEEYFKQNFVKGVIANKGIVKGKVKIVNSLETSVKFKKGDILISINTNPSLLNIIKKASAIVSDEGGLTSHAAIVSRELGIPCIIGTKIATKVFKDNDLVEVDANNGIVRKLK